MTTAQFKEKIQILLSGKQDNGKPIEEVIGDACMGIIESEYVKSHFLDTADNNFIFPKTVLTAVLEELSWQYEPLDGQNKKMVKMVKPFVKFHYSTIKK